MDDFFENSPPMGVGGAETRKRRRSVGLQRGRSALTRRYEEEGEAGLATVVLARGREKRVPLIGQEEVAGSIASDTRASR